MIWIALWMGAFLGFIGGFSVCCFLHLLEDETDWQEMIDNRKRQREKDWELEPITPVI